MKKPLLKYISALLLFGSNGIVASMISLSSYEIVMFRTFIGSILLIVLYIVTNKRFTFFRYKKSFFYLALSGCSMGISWLFLYEAYQQIGVSLASLGYYCGPIIVMAISPSLFKEKFTSQKLVSFCLVFIGIVLINGFATNNAISNFGIFCALMSALMYASMVSFNKKADKIVGMENSTLQLTIAFLTVFIFVIIKQGFHFSIQHSDLIPLLLLEFLILVLDVFCISRPLETLKSRRLQS